MTTTCLGQINLPPVPEFLMLAVHSDIVERTTRRPDHLLSNFPLAVQPVAFDAVHPDELHILRSSLVPTAEWGGKNVLTSFSSGHERALSAI